MRVVVAAAALSLVLSATGRSAPPRPSSGVILDAKSGRPVATVRVNQPIRTAIADGRGGWFIGGGFIRATLAARTGGLLRDWRPRHRARYCSGCSDVTSLIAGRGLLFGGTPGAVLALDARSGATRWRAHVGGFEVNGSPRGQSASSSSGISACAHSTQPRRLRTWSPSSTQLGVMAAASGKRVLISLQPN